MAVEYPPAFVREEVDGVKVVSDLVYESPLSKVQGRFVPIHGIRVLTLEDGSVVHGCRDCEHTDVGPGKIRAHRRERHHFTEEGAAPKPPKREGTVGQIALPGVNSMSRTLFELVDLANEIEAFEQAMEELDAENLRLRTQIAEEKRVHREELAAVKGEHRTAIAEEREKTKKVTKELTAIKTRLGRILGPSEESN